MQCLNVKNKEVAALLNEYTEILGSEDAAYYVLSENNGYGLDKAPNGADSKLFSDLLAHYNGDRKKAILAKSRVYTNSFKNWFGDWLVTASPSDASNKLIQEIESIYNRNNKFSNLAKLLLDNKSLPYNLKYFKIDNNRNDIEGAAGMWHSYVNLIEVLGNNVSQESIDKHLLHELIHYNTEKLLQDYKDGKNTLTDEQRTSIETLYDIINYSKEILNNEIKKNREKFLEIANRQSKPVDSRLFYAFDNQGDVEIDEFISEIFTNPGFQEVLNNIPYKGTKQSLWYKLKEAISKIFGFDINQGSVLEEALKASVPLIQNNNQVSKVVDENGEPQITDVLSTSDNNIYYQKSPTNNSNDKTFFSRLFENKEEQDVNTILTNIENTNKSLKPLTSFLKKALSENETLRNTKITFKESRTEDDNIKGNPAGYYMSESNEIVIFGDSLFKGKNGLADTTILHELIHAATVTNLNFNSQKAKELDNLLGHIRKELSNKYGVSWEELIKLNSDTFYGLTNSKELLSEVFSNSKFINELLRLDSSKPISRKESSIISKIIDWIKSILGITSDNNAYTEAILQLEDIVLNYNSNYDNFDFSYYNEAASTITPETLYDIQTTSNPKYIQEVFEKQKQHIAFEPESHTYTNVETGEVYTPVSTVKDANGYGADTSTMSDEDLVYGKQAAAVGTLIHDHIHNILTGEKVNAKNEFGITMSKEAIKMLKDVVLPKVLGKNSKVIASEQIISNDDAKIAGTLDMLISDNKGNLKLLDIKTKARTFMGKKKYGFDYYFSAKKETKIGGKPDASRHDYQLTMYKRMLEMLGIKVEGKEILPLEYTLDENGVITEVWIPQLDYAQSNGTIFHRTNNALEQSINETVFNKTVDSNIEYDALIKQSEIVNNILKVLKNQLALYKVKGYTTKSEILASYINELNSLEEKEILFSYVNESISLLKPLIDEYNSNLNLEKKGVQDVWNLKTLSAWKNYAESFSNLDDVQDFIFNNPERFNKKELDSITEALATAINYRNVLENSYRSKGEKIWLDWLLPFTSKVESEYRIIAEKEYKKQNKNINISDMNAYIERYVNSHRREIELKSKDLLRQQSKISTSSPVSAFGRWLDTIFESSDVIVGSMAKAYHTRWMESLDDFNARYEELLSLTEELEKTYPEFKNNPEKLYEFMIDTEGDNPRLISKLSPSFLAEYEKIKKEIRINPIYEDSRDRAIAIADWLNTNAPIKGQIVLTKKKLDYIEGLYSTGKISLQQRNTLIKNEKKDQSMKKSWAELVNKGIIDESVADMLRVKFNELNWEHREPISTKYPNKKWEKLTKLMESNPNDIRVRYYNFIYNLSKLGDSYVPDRFKLGGRLPGMSKSLSERLVNGNVPKQLWESFKNQFALRADDTDKGMQMTDELDRPIKFVPIYFTNTLPTSEQSLDLGTIYKEWFRSVNNYRYINSILPQLEYTKWVVSNRKTVKIDSKGNPIKNVLSKIMNNGDSDLDPTTNALITDENLIAQLNTWFDQVVYGETNKDMGTTFGIDNAKALNMFQTYTSLKVMGLNTVSMVNNALMAEVQQSLEAFAGQYVSKESYTKATAEYTKFLLNGDILADVGKRKPKSLVNLLNEKFGIFTDFNEGSLLDNNRIKKLAKTSTLFFTTNIGEHEAQSRFLLASLINKRAIDKDGNDIGSMYDYFTVENGKLVFDKDRKVANFSRKEQIQFGQSISATLRKMHGNYADYSKVALQHYGIGKLALAFRKWIWTTGKRRFAASYYDEFGQTFSKGYYRDGASFTYNKVLAFFNRFVDEAKSMEYAAKADWSTMTENEKANLKRFFTEVSIFAAVCALSSLLKYYEPDDDDETLKLIYNHLDYQLFRLSTDLTFYVNPASFMKVVQSPIPSSSVIRSVSNFFEACLNPFAVYEKGDFKGELKIKKRAMDLLPIVRQIYRLRNIDDEKQLLSIF